MKCARPELNCCPSILWHINPEWTTKGKGKGRHAPDPYDWKYFEEYPAQYMRLLRVTRGIYAALHDDGDHDPWLLKSFGLDMTAPGDPDGHHISLLPSAPRGVLHWPMSVKGYGVENFLRN